MSEWHDGGGGGRCCFVKNDSCVIKDRRAEAWPIFPFWSAVRDEGGLLFDKSVSVSNFDFKTDGFHFLRVQNAENEEAAEVMSSPTEEETQEDRRL